MTDREELLGDILGRIAEELNITDTMYEKAVASYEAVGNWIGEGLDFSVRIMPQGSMNLGTVVRPLSDKDDYDIDLVCLLDDGKDLSPRSVKNLVGNRLKEHKVYAEKLDDEGRRCWTMQYEEFHMDILPCVPHYTQFVQPGQTSIDLTDKNKDRGSYSFKPSDPSAYHDWFLERARPRIVLANNKIAARATEIKPVPSNASRLKTPLQKAIQLLKRHRDVCFQKDMSNAPISILITTLAAQASPHAENVYRALREILDKIPSLIEVRGTSYWVANPVRPEENFAEKWNLDQNKRLAFLEWCAKAKKDFLFAETCHGLDEIAAWYKKVLMPEPVNRAFKHFGDDALKAREDGTMRVVGLTAGLSTAAKVGTTVVPHSFYGA